MLRRFILFNCLCFLIVAFYLLAWDSEKTNSQSANRAVVIDPNKSSISNSKVYSEAFWLKYNGEDLKKFTLAQPLPKIWLEPTETKKFGNQNEGKIEVSRNTQKILYQHWIKALEFRYITEVEKISKDVNYQDKTTSLLNSTIKTEELLLQTSIDEENKSRRFTSDEASQILIIIRDRADQIIEEIKEIDKRKNT